MEDKEKVYLEAHKSVSELSQALRKEWSTRGSGAALLYLREQLGTAGDPEEEKASLPTRMELLAEIVRGQARPDISQIDLNDPEVLERMASFMRRHGGFGGYKPLDPKTDAGRAYLERFRQPPKATEVTERQLKMWAWEVADEKAQASGRACFEFDRNNRYLFADMLYYFAGDKRSKFPLGKGIALFGEVGVGKTILFEVFSTLLARRFPGSSRRFRIKQAREIMREYASMGTMIIDDYKAGNLCIDDTGDEATELKVYGNAIPVIEEILKERYERWKRGSGEMTHITTNLDVDLVYEKYGERAADRLGQMMSFFSVQGHPENGSRRIK